MNSNQGYIKLFRKMRTSWKWYSNALTRAIFIDLLLRAAYEDCTWKGVELKRGEVLTTTKELAEDNGLSPQTVRTHLKKLKLTNEITSKSTNKYSIITICKYESYQSKNLEANKQINKQTNKQKTPNKQSSTPTNKQSSTPTNKQNEDVNEIKSVIYDENNSKANKQINKQSSTPTNKQLSTPIDSKEERRINKEKRSIDDDDTRARDAQKNDFEFDFSQISEWQDLFPNLNVIREVQKIKNKSSAANIGNAKRYVEKSLYNANHDFQKRKEKLVKNGPTKPSSSKNGHNATIIDGKQFGVSQGFVNALNEASERKEVDLSSSEYDYLLITDEPEVVQLSDAGE